MEKPELMCYTIQYSVYTRLFHTCVNIAGGVAAMDAKKEEKVSKEKQDWKKSTVVYLHDLIYMLLAILLVFLVFFRIVVVSGESMYSTLLDGDYLLLISNLFYREPEPGDIIVISKNSYDNGNPIVKRVIAVEGQQVDIDFENGIVYVDGNALQESYINNPTTTDNGTKFPLTVDDNCVFVLGDNRRVSLDSRSPVIGQVDHREILGKAVFLLIPGTNYGEHPQDPDRIGVIE